MKECITILVLFLSVIFIITVTSSSMKSTALVSNGRLCPAGEQASTVSDKPLLTHKPVALFDPLLDRTGSFPVIVPTSLNALADMKAAIIAHDPQTLNSMQAKGQLIVLPEYNRAYVTDFDAKNNIYTLRIRSGDYVGQVIYLPKDSPVLHAASPEVTE